MFFNHKARSAKLKWSKGSKESATAARDLKAFYNVLSHLMVVSLVIMFSMWLDWHSSIGTDILDVCDPSQMMVRCLSEEMFRLHPLWWYSCMCKFHKARSAKLMWLILYMMLQIFGVPIFSVATPPPFEKVLHTVMAIKNNSSWLYLLDALSKCFHSTPWFSKLGCLFQKFSTSVLLNVIEYHWNYILAGWTSRMLWLYFKIIAPCDSAS